MHDKLTSRQELHRKAFELTLALYRVTDFFPSGEALKRQLREKANEIFGGVTEYEYAGSHDREALALFAKVETIKGYLRVSRAMRLVRPINLTILEREYELLENFFKKSLQYSENDNNVGREGGEHGSFQNGLACDRYHTQESYKNEHPSDFPAPALPAQKSFSKTKPVSQETARRASGIEPQAAGITERQKKILDHITHVLQAQLGDLHAVLPGISAKTIQRDLRDLVIRGALKQDGQKRWTTYSIR